MSVGNRSLTYFKDRSTNNDSASVKESTPLPVQLVNPEVSVPNGISTENPLAVSVIGGSSGVSGGGLTQYVLTPNNSLGHGATTRSDADDITLSALPFTFDPLLVAKVERYDSGNLLLETFTPADTAFTYSSNNLMVSGMESDAGDQFVIYAFGIERTVDNTLDSVKTVIQNPTWGRNTSPEHLIDTDDLGETTTRVSFSLEGYKNFALQYILTTANAFDNINLTVWASLDNTATTSADTGWINISGDSDIFGSDSGIDASSGTQSGIITTQHARTYENVMIKLVGTGAIANMPADVWVKRAY